MDRKLKRDEIPKQKAQNWRMNFNEEKKLSFNLAVPQIILKKETYKTLTSEDENRVRIYLGLEEEMSSGKYVMCAFGVASFLMGSGDVYADYETPVFKLGKENENFAQKTGLVIESIRRYRKWRAGEIDGGDELAPFRKYIYPNAYLLTKFELHEIFNTQNRAEAQIDFGVSKTMNVMIYPVSQETRSMDDDSEVFNEGGLCPPHCDERSIYNS
ncbi:MAG TPA: hypothetical protein VKA10_05315 [Prolixibacteraceae bacterium]|nr:hypothetical protein [Prolixibacteraceae bacterium]